MNWDAVSAIANSVGMVAVVVSLLYVARQVRQNSAFSRAASQQTLISQSAALNRWLAETPERIDLLRRAAASFDALSPDDKQVAFTTFGAWMSGLENALYFKEAGICHDAVYDMQARIAELVLRTPGGQEYWRFARHMMGADLRRAVEAMLARPNTLPPLADIVPWLAPAAIAVR